MSMPEKQKRAIRFQGMETALTQIESTTNMIADMSCKGSDATTVSSTDVQQFCWMISDLAKAALQTEETES
jgi:hypothetical protein